MIFAFRQLGQTIHARRFDDGGLALGLPPPLCQAGAMGGVHGFHRLRDGAQQVADDLAEAIAAIAHGQQVQGIVGPHRPPARGDGLGGFPRREGSLELVGNDQDF